MKKYLWAILTVLIVLLLGGYWYISGTPQYSLYQFKQAVQNHDADKALRYIDLDSVVDNLMKDVVAAMDEKKPAKKTGWDGLGDSLAKGMMTMMLPSMKETMRSTIRTSIVSYDDKTDMKNLKDAKLSDLVVVKEGRTATVSSKNNPDVKFKMVKVSDGYWKIVQIMSSKPMTDFK